MCINPRTMPEGIEIPCRKCWQCRQNRINDWVGRCIAERETSVAASFVTLTYGGGDTPQSRFLRKSDMTSYIKAIRNDGYKVRNFFVGEYGTLKGRAHWHCILFWPEPMPHRELRRNISDKWWSHGFSMWDEANIASIRYCTKYIAKELRDDDALRNMGMSRKPMLGTEFFQGLAERYVEAGLSPQRPFYKFREVLDKDGKTQEYYMPPLVRERFVGMFIAAWKAKHPERWWPPSVMVDNHHEAAALYVPPLRFEKRQYRDRPWMDPPDGAALRFDEKLNTFYADVGASRLYWSWDMEGQRAWQEEIVTETEAERRAAEFAARKATGKR